MRCAIASLGCSSHKDENNLWTHLLPHGSIVTSNSPLDYSVQYQGILHLLFHYLMLPATQMDIIPTAT
jgi:hypothetical protein